MQGVTYFVRNDIILGPTVLAKSLAVFRNVKKIFHSLMEVYMQVPCVVL